MPTRRSVAATLLILALTPFASSVHAADPRITRLEPQGGQRGSEVTIRLHGDRLRDAPQDLLLYEPGVELLELTPGDKKFVDARIRIDAECPLGRHALRLRTESGLSNLVTLHVGSLPEANETEPNNASDQAQPIALGTVVNGVVQREDIDCFAVEVAEGQRLSIEVEGLRLGRTFFDPAIEVLGPDGALLTRADDSPPTYQDPSLSLLAPATGRYVIRLRESAFRGGGNNTYRLHVGEFARPSAVFPTAARTGRQTTIRAVGDDSPDAPTTVTLTPTRDDTTDVWVDAKPDGENPSGAPTGMPVRVADRPVAAEAEPNNKRDQATAFTAPAACAGVIGESGDQDHFRFAATKNETWDVRVHARRLRSTLDPVLRIFDAKGKRLAGNDDDQGKPDSYVRFRAPADGEYVLQVEDHLRGGSPTHVYAIEVSRPKPLVDLSIHEQRRYIATTVNVPRGNRTAILVNARRKDVGGPLDLAFGGLPAGVSAESPTIAGNYFRAPVVLSAEESSELAGELVEVTARREGDAPLESRFRQQEWLVRGRNNVPVWSYWSDRAPVAVTKPAPFKIELVEPKAPLVQDGSMNLKVVAERFDGFADSIRVKMLYHSPGVSSNQSRSVVKGKTEALIPVTANGGARTGDWDIVVIGEASVGGLWRVSTKLVKLRIAAPHLALTLPKVAAQRGASVEYVVAIEPKTPFEGAAKVELVGLPPGVKATSTEVTADATEARFQLAIADNARLGRHRSLACRVTLQENDEPVVHTRRGGELLVDPPPKAKPAKAKNEQTAGQQPNGTGASS